MKRRRVCDWCKRTLAGKKGHGFVVRNGRLIICSDCNQDKR